MIRIKIEGKNIADLWRLECVRNVQKMPDNDIVVSVRTVLCRGGEAITAPAYIGNKIEVESEQSEIGRIIYYEP